MLPWALGQIRDRLPQMLERAGGGALVSKLDSTRIEASLARVEELAAAAQSALETQKTGA